MSEALIMKKGMDLLCAGLGIVQAERFISILIREPFDYTEWRKDNLFDNMTLEEVNEAAVKYCNEHQSQ